MTDKKQQDAKIVVSAPWFRMYSDILTDERIADLLSEPHGMMYLGALVLLMASCRMNGQSTLNAETKHIQRTLQAKTTTTQSILKALTKHNLIEPIDDEPGKYHFTIYHEYQELRRCESAERVREFREKRRYSNATVTAIDKKRREEKREDCDPPTPLNSQTAKPDTSGHTSGTQSSRTFSEPGEEEEILEPTSGNAALKAIMRHPLFSKLKPEQQASCANPGQHNTAFGFIRNDTLIITVPKDTTPPDSTSLNEIYQQCFPGSRLKVETQRRREPVKATAEEVNR